MPQRGRSGGVPERAPPPDQDGEDGPALPHRERPPVHAAARGEGQAPPPRPPHLQGVQDPVVAEENLGLARERVGARQRQVAPPAEGEARGTGG
ncbi:hypothetical protein [Deinococcus aetherius]|uniref:hypothetical protein n=1 Tax=Deinococcus aetherius TaxID=200252 RepID=UPI00222F064B|nr:hypothetical protein [Deinococcus aetherius]